MEFLQEWGYIGLFVGTFLAATVVPFSSDFLIIGILLADGNPAISWLIATLGNWLGGITSFYLGWLGKWEWIERYLKVSREKLEKQKERIDQYGAWLALFSWLPFVGDLFAIGLGFYRVNPKTSIAFMLLGKGLRFLGWILLYYCVGGSALLG
ncbi:MAG: DedA family protein [Bacteroidales bacterium]|nr:DedA family protein [Bacteroidales bacterium]